MKFNILLMAITLFLSICLGLWVIHIHLENEEIKQENLALKSELLGFHNLYTSQMNSLIYNLSQIRNDDYADIKGIYDPSLSAPHKLTYCRTLIKHRNRWTEEAITDTRLYITFARDTFATDPDNAAKYEKLLKTNTDGEVMLDIDPVVEFDLAKVMEYQK